MVNKVILIGNLGKDPEISYTQSGTAVCKVSLATTERWTNREGEKQEKTEWHSLVFWGRQAEVANEYLRKGSKIYLEGSIVYRQWEDRDGNKRYNTDIKVNNFQFLTPRGEGGAPPQGESRPSEYQRGPDKGEQAPPTPAQEQQDAGAGEGVHYEDIPPDQGGSGESFGKSDDPDLPF